MMGAPKYGMPCSVGRHRPRIIAAIVDLQQNCILFVAQSDRPGPFKVVRVRSHHAGDAVNRLESAGENATTLKPPPGIVVPGGNV